MFLNYKVGQSSVGIFNYPTLDISYIDQLFSDPRKHKQMSVPTKYKLRGVCTKATLICSSFFLK